jgi:hypothetical protein
VTQDTGGISGSHASHEAPEGSSPIGFDPGRERSLQAIADIIDYWIKWTTREHEAESILVTADTHVWLNGYDGAPPHWPTVGQLKRWVEVLREQPSGE